MADDRTMAQMLQAPIEGYEDVIVVPPINANNFELKQTLINLVQSNQFTGRQDPHNHLREAITWLDKEPPRSILTWEDLVSKFINQFFPPSKTTYLCNEITNFLQKSNETFNEAWERFKDLLHKIPHECLSIIESKSKVRYSRSRVTDVRANANANLSNSQSNSFDLQQIAAALEDKLDIRMNRSGMSYKEPPIPPPGVNQQKPIEVTTDTEPQNSDDIHPPTVQAEVPKDKPADEPIV
nr:hypothetical protein [Tanacetum cinerariifolium]